MKIKSVELKPLTNSKYYETTVDIIVESVPRDEHITVNIYGGYSTPSEREIELGWEPDYGMDHTESQETYEIAKKIIEALNK